MATTLHLIGGNGGHDFSLSGTGNGATLEKLGVWVEGWQVKAIKVWLTDGRIESFGNPAGPYQEYKFKPGECFTSLSLWGNGAGTRLGAIKFSTTTGGQFFAKMTDWGLKAEYHMDVGSGICMGVQGKCGSDIDCMGFIFIKAVKSAVMSNVNYPTIHQVVPQVKLEELKAITYTNDTTVEQEHKLETSKKITKTSTWSTSISLEVSISVEVSAKIPEVAEVKASYGFKMGVETTQSISTSDERMETFSFPIKVPPGKKVEAKATIGRANIDLPFTGTMKITCKDGTVLQYDTSGIYKGVTYTEIKADVQEHPLH